jgi:TolA-binding protein
VTLRGSSALGGAAVLAALGGSGCFYAKQDGERLASEVYALQTQVTAMQQALVELRRDAEALGQARDELSKRVQTLDDRVGRNGADVLTDLEGLKEEVARLKGGFEGSSERISSLESRISQAKDELDLRFGVLEEGRKQEAQGEEARRAAEAAAAARARLLADPPAVFTEVVRLVGAGEAEAARRLLRELSVSWGGNKALAQRHGAQAQFLLGETYFAEQNFQQAAAEYNAVRKGHASSPWVANALYKLGQCFERLSLPGDARLFYREVVEKHGKSQVAKDAKARLKELK